MNKVLASLVTLAALGAASAQATPVRLDGPETNLQTVMNNLAIDGSSSVNAVSDQYALDEGWHINSIFGASGRIVVELAGYAGQNRLGIYDIYDPATRVQLFAGSDGAGANTYFDIGADGRVYRGPYGGDDTGVTFASNRFGFYLDTPAGLWFSQTDLNGDQGDHLVAYQGEGDQISTPRGVRTWGSDMFLLGWEDLSARNWDQDYNDFVLFVSGVEGVNVPEPATLGLFGLGLAGLGVFRRRRQKA